MPKKPIVFDRLEAAGNLRHRAETWVKKQHGDATSLRTQVDTERLLHELRVHQVELELQNTELQRARDEAETALERYTDLYDFAPVGYFTIDAQGRILETNLTGAALLGIERSRSINLRFQSFLSPSSRPAFLAMLARVMAKPCKEVCEVSVQNSAGAFWADLQASSAACLSGPGKCCRVAVSDISALKRAEEAQRRMAELTAANQKLRREIVRRQAVETALKKSEEQQRRLLEESRQMQEQLRHLSHRVLQAQEEERKRISRDLHDQVAQALVGINVHLAALTQDTSINSTDLKGKIARTQRLVEKSVNVVHRFARELRPTLLDDLGLIPALHSFMKDFRKRTGIHMRFTTFTTAKISELDSAKATVLYRVAQEALANVARHAQASHVQITIKKLPQAIEMEVADDGKGFEVEQVMTLKRHSRLGVVGMRERLQMVGGHYSLNSAPGKGTTIRARIPLRIGGARGGGGAVD
jgi:PAS domain S-box-containing protein